MDSEANAISEAPVGVLIRGNGGAFSFSCGEFVLSLYQQPKGDHQLFTESQVRAMLAAERERCAKLCQQVAEENANQDSYHWYGCMDCKTAIEGIKDQAIHPAHSAPAL